MKVSNVQTLLSLHGGATVKRAEAIATELRSAGLLPKGGRGPHAPEISKEETALYTLAVAGAERIADAASDAQNLGATVNASGRSLVSVLAQAITSPEQAHAIYCVRVMAHIPMAEVVYRHDDGPGTTERFFVPSEWARAGFKPFAQAQGFAGRIGHIGGAILVQMVFHDLNAHEIGELVG